MTIGQLADATGLTKGFISRIERDQTSPSVSTLVTLCQVLGVAVGDLFIETDARHIQLDDAPLINLGGRAAVERLLSPRREGRFQVIRSSIEPGGNGGDALYTLGAEVELVHVIGGSVNFEFGDRSWQLDEGDSLTFDAREPHNWHASSDTGADLIWVIVPAVWHS